MTALDDIDFCILHRGDAHRELLSKLTIDHLSSASVDEKDQVEPLWNQSLRSAGRNHGDGDNT